MICFRTCRRHSIANSLPIAGFILQSAFLLWVIAGIGCGSTSHPGPLRNVSTVAGKKGEIGEPFGIAFRGNEMFVSDGQNGQIWTVTGDNLNVFARGLDTPSAIAFDKAGNLLVADAGSNTVRSISSNGETVTIAGIEGQRGFADGPAAAALFSGPIGLAISKDGKIFVADTYNDRIRVIENGQVTTFAGGSPGFADGVGTDAKFHTPCGIAVWRDRLLVADTGNRRIRVVEPDGRVWTLAGSGELALKDGLLSASAFVQPTAIAVDERGAIFVADGNAIRQIAGDPFPFVRTISSPGRGLRDGVASKARFNRPSGLALDQSGSLLVADSENRLVRRFDVSQTGGAITSDEIKALRETPENFRTLQPPRWPYDPPDAKRDIAGTLGEIRGELPETKDQARFHNGLDIAGAYGETARFVRTEKVLKPIAAENFGTTRESLRMPSMGYIHIRLGRDVSGVPFADNRFQFEKNAVGKPVDVRVPRGALFNAGEPIGTLNTMNHVHLIAGRSGSEMNALDALIFPGLTDSRPPTIEKVSLFDENWNEIETRGNASRIKLSGKTRIVVRAFDQTDGNSDRRRLGIYEAGYQVLDANGAQVSDTNWNIKFDRMPSAAAVKFAYAAGSKSGATGETIFNYIATNVVSGDEFHEGFLDIAALGGGQYTLRVSVADYFGNITHKDIMFEVIK